MTTHVAFFRNLNLGQPGSPSGVELTDAFGGQRVARNFQTNGTVVFDSNDLKATTRHALELLRAAGYTHEVMVRTLDELIRIVAETPADDPAEGIYRSMISFFDLVTTPVIELPLRSPDQLVELRTLEATYARSVCWKPRNTAGNVTGFLEGLLQAPVTTRTTGTLQRLIHRAGRAVPDRYR